MVSCRLLVSCWSFCLRFSSNEDGVKTENVIVKYVYKLLTIEKGIIFLFNCDLNVRVKLQSEFKTNTQPGKGGLQTF